MCQNCATGGLRCGGRVVNVHFHCLVFLNRILIKGTGGAACFGIVMKREPGASAGLSISILNKPTGMVGDKFLKPVWFECAFES